MLEQLLVTGFGDKEDFNCAEKIVYGANHAYNLGLDKNALKLSAGFGGGMGIESICGALTGCIIILSSLYVKDIAHESTKIKELTQKLFYHYQKEMGSINCDNLKDKYRTPELKCQPVILVAARILDKIILEEKISTIK